MLKTVFHYSMDDKLKINEIFYSIQGESTLNGLPCVFVRLTYCNLRCTYCDTEYAFFEGKEMIVDEIIGKVRSYNCNLVEITGGEPLIQDNVYPLMEKLCDLGYDVMVETGGSFLIDKIDKRVKVIMDLKTPSSSMTDRNMYDNIHLLKRNDEIKFVIGDKTDYDWSKEILNKYHLNKKCIVLFSPVFGKIENIKLAEWILEDKLKVRMQIQLHKYIWHPETKGV